MEIRIIDEMSRYLVKVSKEELKNIKISKELLCGKENDFNNTEILSNYNNNCFDKDEVNYIIDLCKIIRKAYKKLKKGKPLKHKHLVALSVICKGSIKEDIEEKLKNVFVW
jgi:hypothetical protein